MAMKRLYDTKIIDADVCLELNEELEYLKRKTYFRTSLNNDVQLKNWDKKEL